MAVQKLYEDLLKNYNNLVRPVTKTTRVVDVKFGAYLLQLIDVDEKSQIMTTNMWLEMEWKDHRLAWEPSMYENVTKIHIPSSTLWTPDIVLYNNAIGNPEVSKMTNILVVNDGKVIWKPPAIYFAFCQVNMAFFPYDDQLCPMKFGTWSHDGSAVNLLLMLRNDSKVKVFRGEKKREDVLLGGMDLSYYHRSAEWEILNVTAIRHEALYPGCCGDEIYVDITFYIHFRRMALFYTANIMVPCVLIGILTVFVFHLPAREKKITLSVSIMVTYSVFFVLLTEIMPATSLSIPMLGQYLLFNMSMVAMAVVCTVCTMRLYKSHTKTRMSSTTRKIMYAMGKFLRVPEPDLGLADTSNYLKNFDSKTVVEVENAMKVLTTEASLLVARSRRLVGPEYGPHKKLIWNPLKQCRQKNEYKIKIAVANVRYISKHYAIQEKQKKVKPCMHAVQSCTTIQ